MNIKVVNIETGMPTVDEGCRKLYFEIVTAKRQGVKVLKVIHGYGSSGVGGGLKKGITEYLAANKKNGFIKAFVPGADWDVFNQTTRDLLEKCGDLRKDNDLGNGNPGITIVLI